MGGQDIFVCGKMMSKPGKGRWVTARKLGGWTLGACCLCPSSVHCPFPGPPRASLEPPAPPPNWRRPGQSAQTERAGRGLPDPRGPRAALHQSRSSNRAGLPFRLGTCWVGAGWCALAPVSHFAGRVCLGPKPAQVPGGGGGCAGAMSSSQLPDAAVPAAETPGLSFS